MATKKGILSDKMMMVNCVDYKALPVGFANSEFQGGMSNPFLPGIKTPKYQRSAPKPASADIVAVSTARFMVGNRATNARLILDQYQKEAKEWKPPRVNLAKINRDLDDADDRMFGRVAPYVGPEVEQVASILPSGSAGVSRGALMTQQTIGQDANPSFNVDRLMSAYASSPNARQLSIGSRMGDIFQREGITYSNYAVSSQVLKGKRISSQPTDEGAGREDRMAMLKRGIAVLEMRGSNVNLDEVFGILAQQNLPPPEAVSSTRQVSSTRSGGAGSSTDMSDALTQQGVAQPATSKLSAEIYKK